MSFADLILRFKYSFSCKHDKDSEILRGNTPKMTYREYVCLDCGKYLEAVSMGFGPEGSLQPKPSSY